MQVQLVNTNRTKSRAWTSSNLAPMLGACTGSRFRLVVYEQNEDNSMERRRFNVEVFRPTEGAERELRIYWSDSEKYPVNEGWSIPIATLVNDKMPEWLDRPSVYLKKFRLWMTLRRVMREQNEWTNIILQ